jgi:hypothetical protein
MRSMKLRQWAISQVLKTRSHALVDLQQWLRRNSQQKRSRNNRIQTTNAQKQISLREWHVHLHSQDQGDGTGTSPNQNEPETHFEEINAQDCFFVFVFFSHEKQVRTFLNKKCIFCSPSIMHGTQIDILP